MKLLVILLVAWFSFGSALAQSYPSRPVTLIVPYAAGGPMDRLARDLVEQLRAPLGQPMLVENVAGAGGNIGVSKAKRAAPDGYTLLLDHIHMATAPALNRKLDFNPERDFAPLGVIAEQPLMLVTRLGVPATTMPELLHWVVKRPITTLAHAGIGSASHLCGLLLQRSLRLELTQIPYRGTGPAMIDLMGGQVDLLCDLTSNALPQVMGRRINSVAISQPLASAKELPSFAVYGIRDAELSIWFALYAPKDTPPAVLARLTAFINVATAEAAFIRRQRESGILVVEDYRSTPEGHRKFLHEELLRFGPILQTITD